MYLMDPHRSAGFRNSSLYYSYLLSFSTSCSSSSCSSGRYPRIFTPVSSSSLSYSFLTSALSLSISATLPFFRRYLPWKPPLRYIHFWFDLICLFYFTSFSFPGTHGVASATLPSLLYFLFPLFITLHSLLAVDCISLVHLFGHRFLIRSRARGSYQIIKRISP